MTAQALAIAALKNLVVWRCSDRKCGFELYAVPTNWHLCRRCGLDSPLHGIFSDDRDGLVKLLVKAAQGKK